MRSTLHPKLSAGRIRTGHMATDDTWGLMGSFRVTGPNNATLLILASDATDPIAIGWEHVSVSLPNRTPNWPEMCFVKNLFWEPEETVIQIHPPESSYVSNHPYCLHMWRDVTNGHRLPPTITVGVKEAGELKNPEQARRLDQQIRASLGR